MQKNSTILNSVWLSGTSDYQQRVPSPTVATQAQQAAAIFSPGIGGGAYNYFVDTLINRIGLTYARSQSWRNPLAGFKRGTLQYGDKVQELQAKWVRAHSYEDDKQTLMKVHRPEVEAVYHQVDRFDQYPMTVNKIELRQAFTSEYGLNELVASIMDAVINSANYDEYIQMKNLIQFYAENWGFYQIQLPEPDDDTSAKNFLKSLKAMVGRLAFPSALYNAQVISDIPVFASPDELILLVTPEAAASVDVDALATLFHLEPADAQVRRVIVDEFPIPGAYAMLTTTDWFQVYDQVYENGSFYNPETLNTNYYLTIMQVISCSPFVPAIIWTTEAATTPVTVTQTTDGTLTASVYTRNQLGNFASLADGTEITKAMVTGRDLDGTPSDVDGIFIFGQLGGSLSDGTTSDAQEIDGISVRPDAYRVTGISFSGDGAPAVNSRTYVDRNGRLHLQAGAYKSSEGLTLTITVEPVYANPDGTTPEAVPTTVTLSIAAGNGGGGGGTGMGLSLVSLRGSNSATISGIVPAENPGTTGSSISVPSSEEIYFVEAVPADGATISQIQAVTPSETYVLVQSSGNLYSRIYSSLPLTGVTTITVTMEDDTVYTIGVTTV